MEDDKHAEEGTGWSKMGVFIIIFALIMEASVILVVACIKCNPRVRYLWWDWRYQIYHTLHSIFRIKALAKKLEEECDKRVICIENQFNKKKLYYMDDVYDQKSDSIGWGMNKRKVEQMWVSHGPTGGLAQALINYFGDNKPVIYIGRLVHYSQEDRQGLKKLFKEGFELAPWKQESDKVYPAYVRHLKQYFQQSRDELGLPTDQQNDYRGRDREVADIACGEIRVTHLLTSEGRIYRSDCHCHAEVVFTRNCAVQPCKIKKIWIKNSPCASCSSVLIKHFQNVNKPDKPEIQFGSIYKFDDKLNFNGMVDLCSEDFELNIWREYNKKKYGPKLNPKIVEYLERVEKTAAHRRRH